jgi:hypothetical protein
VAQAQADTEHLKDLVGGASQQAQNAYGQLLAENFEFQNTLASVTAGESIDAVAKAFQDKWGLSDAQMVGIREGLRIIATMGVSGGSKAGGGSPKGSSGAESSVNGKRYYSQILAEEVASGHAYDKHVVTGQEFADLGINTRGQFQELIENIVLNPATEVRRAVDGTTYYLDNETKTIVIRGQRGEATAFRPDKGGAGWDVYIKSQVPKK